MKEGTKRSLRTTNSLLAMLIVAIIAVPSMYAIAATTSSSQPANKTVAAGSKIVTFAPGVAEPILSTEIKASAPTDLVFNASLECDILAQTETSNAAGDGFSEAQGTVRVWVEFDGKIVPINSLSGSPPTQTGSGSTPGNESDKVTFCHHDQAQQFTDNPGTEAGGDMLTLYNETKTANAFNWIWLNANNIGPHTVVLCADLSTNATSNATAQAYVGNRTLVVDPEKFANDASVQPGANPTNTSPPAPSTPLIQNPNPFPTPTQGQAGQCTKAAFPNGA